MPFLPSIPLRPVAPSAPAFHSGPLSPCPSMTGSVYEVHLVRSVSHGLAVIFNKVKNLNSHNYWYNNMFYS